MANWLSRALGRGTHTRTDTVTRSDNVITINPVPTSADQFTFRSWLETNQIWDTFNKQHCENMAQHMSLAYRVVHLSDHVFTHGFTFLDPKGQEISDYDFVISELEALEWRKNFTLWDQYERTHGYSPLLIVQEGENYRQLEAPVKTFDPQAVINGKLFPVNPTSIQEISLNETTGLPELVKINFINTIPGVSRMHDLTTIHASRFLWANMRPIDMSYQGLPLSRPCWPQLVWYHFIQAAMSHQAAKLAGGLLLMPISAGAGDKEKQEIKDAMQNANYLRGITYPETVTSGPTFAAPPIGQTPFVSYLDALLGDVSIVTELPKTYLLGTEAGAVTGSVINSRQVYAAIVKDQRNFEPLLKQLILIMHPELADELTQITFKWKILYSLGRMEEAELAAKQAEANVKELAYTSVNEMREKMHLPSIAGGDKPLSLVSQQIMLARQQGEEGGSPKARPQSSPEQSAQAANKTDSLRLNELLGQWQVDSWPLLRNKALVHATTKNEGHLPGVQKICDELGISTATYYAWEVKYASPP